MLDHCLIVTSEALDSGQWTVDSRNVIMFGAAVRDGGLLQPGTKHRHSQCDLHQVGALVHAKMVTLARS